MCNSFAFAVGFGDAALRSYLGDVLRAQIPLTGATEDILVPSCLKSRIESLDGQLIDVPRIEIVAPDRRNGAVNINVVSNKVIAEPVVRLSLTLVCGSTVHRDYSLLLDYPDYPAAVPLSAAPSANQETVTSQPAISKKPERVIQPVKKTPVASAPVAPVAPAEPEAVKPVKRSAARHKELGLKDVLQVTPEDGAADIDLKMSQSLSTPDVQNTDQLRLEENRQAQAQFAALINGEDLAQTEIQKERQKNKKLQDELNRLQQQNLRKNEVDKKSTSFVTGLIIIAVALLTALAALITVAVRRARNREDKSWWDASSEQKKNVVDIVDYLQNSAEQGELDPNPITVARDVAAPEIIVKPELAQPAATQEQPAPKFKRTGLPALEDTNSSTFNFFGNRSHSIHIEEISDITQEAEFWMSVNDPQRAIEILEPQSREENPATPVTWLYLLDLYRLVGDQDNYRDLRQRFKHKFNARIPNFHEEVVPGSMRSFEDFPHLISNCCALWTTDDIAPYLESLLVDDREGERMGFDLPVYRDILFLLSICHELKRTKYEPLTNKEGVTLTRKAAAVLTPLEDHLVVKPEDHEAGEYSNSLNFDLLDFKSDKDKK